MDAETHTISEGAMDETLGNQDMEANSGYKHVSSFSRSVPVYTLVVSVHKPIKWFVLYFGSDLESGSRLNDWTKPVNLIY